MATGTQTNDASQGSQASEPLVHILWMNGGLGCDGDSVALTAATQPSIEEIALGALPGLPKIANGLANDFRRDFDILDVLEQSGHSDIIDFLVR